MLTKKLYIHHIISKTGLVIKFKGIRQFAALPKKNKTQSSETTREAISSAER